jgi:hypothetical protein
VKSKFQEDDCPEFSVHDYAFKMLIADIHEDLTVRKQAFLMTQLLQKYLDYLPAHIPNIYPVTKLQEDLKYITVIQSLYRYSADRGCPT